MTTMLAELYDALLAAAAPEEKARKAAEAVAAYEDRFARIKRRLTVLSWQVGALTAVVVAVGAPALWLLVRVAAKIGAIG
jgi:hypothetical protein